MLFVSAVCRLTTVAALMLHLIFGCSLHHSAACERHDHDRCRHTCESAPLSMHGNHACIHDHHHSGRGKTPEGNAIEADDSVRQLASPCCVCESQPCDGNHPGFHGEVECSFVPSSDDVFIIDAPFVAYVTYEHDPMMTFVSSMAKRRLHQRSARLSMDSLSHCASLCTWII